MLIQLFFKFFLLYIEITNCKELSNKYKIFENWLLSNGAYISPKITPVEKNINYRSIVANATIKQNETLAFIPENLLISSINKIVNPFCYKLFSYDEKINEFECILSFIAYDIKNNNSFFKPYYDYFPSVDFIHPLFYSEDLKQKYEITEITDYLDIYNIQINNAYQRLKKYHQVDYSIFLESLVLVLTRNFGRKNSEYFEDINTMVPYFDLLNHDNDCNSDFYYDDKKHGFFLNAIKNIEIGEEITDSYGKENNLDLFINYGFTIKNNQYKIPLYFSIKHEPYSFHKINEKELLEKIRRIQETLKYTFDKSLFLLNNKIDEKIIKLNKIKTDDINMINIINEEIESYNMLKKLIQNFLANHFFNKNKN